MVVFEHIFLVLSIFSENGLKFLTLTEINEVDKDGIGTRPQLRLRFPKEMKLAMPFAGRP